MLLSLPNELLTNIAYFLATGPTTPCIGPPSALLPLLLAHPTFNDALSFDKNPSLYAQILHETFDTDAIGRRFGSDVLGDSTKAAGELKTRWTLLHRIRRAAESEIPIPEREGGLQTIADDLLQVFMILTENDGRNLGHLLVWANLPNYLLAFHHQVMIPMALEPGYPEDTPDKALHITIAYWLDEAAYFMKQRNSSALSSREDENASLAVENFYETAAQIDEKIFVTRPFALALHKFDAYFGPWTKRNLPLPPSVQPPPPLDPSIPVDPHLADLRPRKRAVQMTRFNREWSIAPPILTLSASMGLMNQLDRTPCVGGLSASSSNSSTASLDFLYPYSSPPSSPTGRPFVAEPSTETYLRKSLPLVNLPSTCHDLDVKRLLACGDPWKGGLDALAFRGKIEGRYHGSFSFFDFAGYREMLSGEMGVLFEGTFGQQAQEIILSERVVRIHRDLVGGSGPLINAGFPLPGSPPDPFTLCYSKEEEDTPEPEGSEFVKEILVDGTGRSGWGNFKLTGRVRAWDGMISLVKEYVTQDSAGNEPTTRGKWFYRGYVMQDSRFVGCWRDCFTDESFRGYEGSFHMRKQDERFVVPLLSNGSLASPSRNLPPQLRASDSYVCSWPENDNEAAAADSDELCERSLSPTPAATSRTSTPTLGGTLASINFAQVANSSLRPTPASSSHSSSTAASSSRVPLPVPSSSSSTNFVVGLTGDIDPAVLRDLHHSGFQEELSSGVFGGKRKRDESSESAKGETGGSWGEKAAGSDGGEGAVGLEKVVGYLHEKVELRKKSKGEGSSSSRGEGQI